jgi:hypothetical protein
VKNASIRQSQYRSKSSGGRSCKRETSIAKRRRMIAKSAPENIQARAKMPDFMKRLRSIYGKQLMPTTGAEIIAEDQRR